MEKNIYFFKKKDFSVFFPFISMFWMKMKEKTRNIINFHGNSFFFSQNCINYPVSSVSWRINFLSKKDIFILVKKKGIYAILRKKFLFTEVNFLMIFCLFHCFHQTIKKKTLNIATIYFFYVKFYKLRFLSF